MPCKQNQSLPKPKCTLSSRRLLETVPIQELHHPGVVCVQSPNQISKPCPSKCGSCACDDDVSASAACCSDPQCEEDGTPLPKKDPKTPTCLPPCQATEVEAMIDEIRSCREIIRSLALEAMDILHPENSQQYKQVQVQEGPIANGMTCSQRDDDSEAKPIDLRKTTDCSEKKCSMAASRKYSGLEGQSMTRLSVPPPILSKSPALSRKSSGPIAQTAHQIKEKRLVQNLVKRKPSNCSCDGERKQSADCRCDETMNMKALKLKPSECSCDGKPKKKDDCKCDDTIKKRNKELEKIENKTNSKSFLQKTFGWINCDTGPAPAPAPLAVDDDEMEKQNIANSLKEKRKQASASSVMAAACAMPKCAANTCTCHFPPAYSQYFDCTGHVSGNCQCDKNA